MNMKRLDYIIIKKREKGWSFLTIIGLVILATVTLLLFGCTDEESLILSSNDDNPAPMTDTMFYTDVKSIIDLNCATANCHSGLTPETGLNMESYSQIIDGSDNGTVVFKGNSQLSLMYHTLVDQPQMPVDMRLPQSQIDSIGKWIEDGLYENRE